jgi:RimJ/RimL family protein N-acetyltransferase
MRTYGCDRVGALIRPENFRSVRVAERLGLSLVRFLNYKGYNHGLWCTTF